MDMELISICPNFQCLYYVYPCKKRRGLPIIPADSGVHVDSNSSKGIMHIISPLKQHFIFHYSNYGYRQKLCLSCLPQDMAPAPSSVVSGRVRALLTYPGDILRTALEQELSSLPSSQSLIPLQRDPILHLPSSQRHSPVLHPIYNSG